MQVEEFVIRSTTVNGFVRMTAMQTMDCKKTTLEKATSRAWHVALIITGSPSRAERAVTEAIDLWDLNPEFEEKLWLFAVAASLRSEKDNGVVELPELEGALRLLPVELGSILYNSPIARKCFVLRFLVGLAEEVCAAVLALTRQQVNEYTCMLLRDLAHMELAGKVREVSA
jgi:hypothetical protein